MTIFGDVNATKTLSNNVMNEPPVTDTKVSNDSAAAHSNSHTQIPDTPESRTAYDAQLAKTYASALATHSYETSMLRPDVQVPAQSTLGRWRTQLDSAFKSPGFLQWANTQGLDIKSLKLDPFLGELTGSVNGKMQTFSLKDDSGWSDVSRLLLSIARVIAPARGQAFSYPWPEGKVPLHTVGRFYAAPIDLTPSQAASHIEKLKAGSAFEFAPVGHAPQRSIEALKEQGKALGDDANHHALLAALRSLVGDAEGKVDLNNARVPIDQRSSLFLTEQLRDISVAQMLEKHGHQLPDSLLQAHSLADSLSFDLAHRMPGPDAGGVRHIVGLLNVDKLDKIKNVVDQWMSERASPTPGPQAGAGSLINILISALPASTQNMIADNPAVAMDQLIRSPEAQALGKAIQKEIGLAESPTSAIEAVTAALIRELDPNPGKSRFNLAGYNLYKSENVGVSAAEIVKRFTAHLETKVDVKAAPLAAQLLLSAVAPELLIDTGLVHGAHGFKDFMIAVALVDDNAAGASANMTPSQILDYAEAQLNILSKEELSLISVDAVIAYGLGNQEIKVNRDGHFTGEDIERSLTVAKQQGDQLDWARSELLKPPPTREGVALAEFKRVFPDIDPTKTTLRGIMDGSYIVSPLDVYMTEPFEPDMWRPIDEKELPWEQMKLRFSELHENINEKFSNIFDDYTRTQSAAESVAFKYHLSLMPLAEQERIKQSDVTFLTVSRPFLGTEEVNNLSLYPGRQPRTPTPHELKELEGGQGVLMKVEGPDGKVDYYSYFPGLGKIVKEQGAPSEYSDFDDSNYFSKGSKNRVSGTYNVVAEYGVTNKERDSPGVTGQGVGPYFSERNGSLATVVGDFFTKNHDYLKTYYFGATRIEENTRRNQSINEFLLSLVPFYDGIRDAINGNVAGAVFNIGFDILGFLLPGASAANRALKLGKSTGKVLARSFFAGLGASVGVTDIIELPKNIKRGIVALGKDARKLYKHTDEILPRLKGNYRAYDVSKAYKDGEIVKGAYKTAPDGVSVPVVAMFQKGAWYAFDTVTKTPFGPQLAQFGLLDMISTKASNNSNDNIYERAIPSLV